MTNKQREKNRKVSVMINKLKEKHETLNND
jgi:hypothetical protein